MQQHRILLIKDEKQESLYFKFRSDLKKEENKKKLLTHYKVKNSIRCMCDQKKELYLYVKENGVVAVYPKSEEHKENCPFYSKREEFIDDETGEYKSNIFKEVISHSKLKGKESGEEKCQRLTYYDFCREAIAIGALDAFRHDYERYNKIYNITFNQFCFSYSNGLKNLKLKGNEDVYTFFKNNKEYKFEYGILNNDLLTLISENAKDEDIKSINIDEIKYDYTNKKWVTQNKNAKISHRRLRLSKKLVQIWNNLIEPPFFYTAVYHDDIIIRFHLMPIFLNEKNIVFVESNFERNYAKKLIEEKIVFIKPISNDEVYKIEPKIINTRCEYIPEIKFHPDFLEFSNNKMIITEVSGFTDKDYVNHLEKKMRYYLKYIENKEFLFEYKCIDGKSLEAIDYKFDPDYWDGEELVQKGSFQGKKWSEIYEETLNWYNENTNGYFKDCAVKELKRRNLIDDI